MDLNGLYRVPTGRWGMSRISNAVKYRVVYVKPGTVVRCLGRPAEPNPSWGFFAVGSDHVYMDARGLALVVKGPAKPKTKGDLNLAYLNAAADNPDRLDEYVWGAEGEKDRDHDGFAESDCSGGHHASLVYAGVPDERTTADGYYHRGHRIDAPSAPGDYAVMLNADGHAHHIVNYAGDGKVVEWRGAAYGVERHDLANIKARGGIWLRDNRVYHFLQQPA